MGEDLQICHCHGLDDLWLCLCLHGHQLRTRRRHFPKSLEEHHDHIDDDFGRVQLWRSLEAFGADVVSRGFAMFLLLLLIVLGTITMVNLFVVVIISDLTKLQQEVFHRSLVNMATASILVESLLPSKMLWRCRVPETVVLCSHTLCPAACQGLKLDRAQDMLVVKEGIKAVMKRKEGNPNKLETLQNCQRLPSQLSCSVIFQRCT